MAPATESLSEDQRAFDEYARGMVVVRLQHLGLLVAAILTVALIVDAALLWGTKKLDTIGVGVPLQIAGCLLCSGSMRYSTWAQRRPAVVASVLFGLVSAVGAAVLSSLGGFDGPYFYAIYVTPAFVMILPFDLAGRLAVSVATVGSFLAAFLIPHPEYLSFPLLHIPFSYLGAGVVVNVVLGHWTYRLMGQSFFAERELEQRRAALADEVELKTGQIALLGERLASIRDAERTEIARALHDDLGQLILGARMELETLALALTGGEGAQDADGELAPLRSVVSSLETSAQRIVSTLRNPDRTRVPLDDAVARMLAPLSARDGLTVQQTIEVDGLALDDAAYEALFRTAQESVTNALKHANASRISVYAGVEDDGATVLSVRDDGAGFDASTLASRAGDREGGWGLVGMRERIEAAGGTLRIDTGPGGTRIEARFAAAS